MAEYAAIPNFGQFTEYVTQGNLVDNIYTGVINHVDMGQLPVVEAAETLKADYEKVNTLKRLPKIPEKEKDAIKIKLSLDIKTTVSAKMDTTDNPILMLDEIIKAKSALLSVVGVKLP